MAETGEKSHPEEPTELIPDTWLTDEALDESDSREIGPSTLEQVREHVAAQGLPARLIQLDPTSADHDALEVEVQAGGAVRTIRISSGAAEDALGIDFSEWNFLGRYDAVWSASKGIIEAVVRPDRFGMPSQYLLSRLSGRRYSAAEGGDSAEATLSDASGVSARIGRATLVGAIILGGGRRRFSPMTLTLTGLTLESPADAESAIEAVADALIFECELAYGSSLSLVRLEPREPISAGGVPRRPSPPTLQFPTNRYPHEAVMLFKAGRERTSAPTIRYWAFYQVLEYFFPAYSFEDARRRLARLLRDPRFDVFSDDDLTKAIQQLSPSGRGPYGREQEQLLVTIEAIVEEEELRSFISGAELLAQRIADRKSEVSTETVSLRSPEDIRRAVAHRVYDVRCRIVHSKSESERASGPGLIPGSHHDDLVRYELPLIQFLAERALIASAERLILRAQGNLGAPEPLRSD